MAEYLFTPEGIKSPKGGFLRFSTAPYAHQLRCLEQFGDSKYFALLAEMGTGKTWIIINNYAYLLAKGDVRNMLVVAPNGVQWNWVKNELPAHLPAALSKKVLWAGFSGNMLKRERDALDALLSTAAAAPSVLCVNWNALSYDRGVEVIRTFLAADESVMVVLDESDFCKNPATKVTKTVLDVLAPAAKYRRIMTGTPIVNSPFDAWSQFNFLSPAILNSPSYVAFKRRHGVFLPVTHPLVRAVQGHSRGAPLIPAKDSAGHAIYKNLDKLTAAIEPVSFRVLKADCLDLPPKVYTSVYVDLTPTQKKVYNIALKQNLVLLKNDAIPVTNKVAILSHLHQLTGNHYAPSLLSTSSAAAPRPGSLVDTERNPKLERALEIIGDVVGRGGSIIVWARYRAEIGDLVEACTKAGFSAVSYYGDTSPAARLEAVTAFENGAAKVFIANPASAGTGLTLVAASTVLYYSNSFSLHDRLQSEDRAHRIGQKRSVTYIDLIARDTIDERVVDVLKNKRDVASLITNFTAAAL